MTAPALDELSVRHAAFEYVRQRADASGGVVTRAELESFIFAGEPIKLIDQSRGIRNPRQLIATLSILSQPKGPYDDDHTEDGLLRYAYRAGPIDSGDNRKLRRAAELGLPLLLLEGIAPSVFVPIAPVFLRRDVPDERYVEVAVDEGLRFVSLSTDETQRSYVERLTKLRLHQPVFRARVIRAYSTQCAMCRLRHADLLDAAHIIPDGRPRGEPVVSNGLSLCKIHHAAYDRNMIGIRPDLVVEVKPNILLEADGPMLRHGIQEMQGRQIVVPSMRGDQPDPARLRERYDEFAAS
ncbi:MAG: HNH endonuclease [Frankiaceae bacterium]|nr:HNH endonuclease [Frankiaceae bacterium]